MPTRGCRRRLAIAVLLTLAVPAAAQIPSPLGEWTTEGDKARVRIAPCSGDAQRLCGVIDWSYRPPGAEAGPLLDINNQDPALRSRPIVGLPLLQGFAPTGPDSWGAQADRAFDEPDLFRLDEDLDECRPSGLGDFELQQETAVRAGALARWLGLHPLDLDRRGQSATKLERHG
jgi:hypothetical protein